MQAVTLSIALSAVTLMMCSSPIFGVVVYVAALAWYPIYLTIPVGTIDFTVCRIVIMAMYARLFLHMGLPRQFKFIWLDKLIIAYFFCQILAGLQTMPVGPFLENRSGAILNEVLPYFAVRMLVRRKEHLLLLLKSFLLIAAPLALVGFYQCLTGHNPVGFLQKYAAFGAPRNYVAVSRIGFYRANVTFGETIMFGMFFAMLWPMCVGLLQNVHRNRWLYLGGIGLMLLGVFSSMSSGALFATLLAFAFIAFYPFRVYWKPVTVLIILMCGSVEIISNRHFYDVLGDFTFNPATAWYRSRLIDVALFEGGMSGHWLVGYGFEDPGWGPMIKGLPFTDLVNHYIVVLCRYGLFGLIPFIAVVGAAVKRIVVAFRKSTSDCEKWVIWCLCGSVFGILPAMMSVSLFGPAITVFYIMLALCGVVPDLVSEPESPVRRYAD